MESFWYLGNTSAEKHETTTHYLNEDFLDVATASTHGTSICASLSCQRAFDLLSFLSDGMARHQASPQYLATMMATCTKLRKGCGNAGFNSRLFMLVPTGA